MRVLLCLCILGMTFGLSQDSLDNARPPGTPDELNAWLANMKAHHFSLEEMRAATGLPTSEIEAALSTMQWAEPKAELRVFPYPGGRHPRIGFLEGAIRPQRETKVSVFAPWNSSSYVVADVPEAIWWNRDAPETADRQGRELIYLAHNHVPTYWTRQDIELEPLEWKLEEDGSYVMHRKLPNEIEFGTRAWLKEDHVALEQWLTNGTDQTLTGLKVQNCIMLKGAPEFAEQSNENKLFEMPYAACRDESGNRWVITAWERCVRPWGNMQCPCLHSDPQFEDCPPGETVRIRGWLSFYEGEEIETELKRIEETGWRK